jgi:hypothetical protein
MADQIVSWGGIDSKGTSGMGVTGSLSVLGSGNITRTDGDGYLKIGNNGGGTIIENYNRTDLTLKGTAIMTSRGTGVTFRNSKGEPNGAILGVIGSGTTSSTTSLLVQNANATNMLSLTDNGALTINTFQTSSAPLTINRTLTSMGSNFNAATMGRLITINDTVGNSNAAKTSVYINTTGASQNNALIVENGSVGFGTTSPGSGFTSNLFTTLGLGLRVNNTSNYQITSRDTRQIFNTTHGGGISFWGGSAGQGEAASAYAGIRGLKANNTYLNSLGSLAFYIQTGSSQVVDETTFKEAARFNELGYFGIGTSTPSSSLHISGASAVLTLSPQDPLPSGVPTGSFAVSSSAPPKPYFYDGTTWNALY